MALEWLVSILIKAGIDAGIQSVQRWQQGRYLDLNGGRPGSKVRVSVILLPTRSAPVGSQVVLLALEREAGWHHALYGEPSERFRVRVERGIYTLCALDLAIPRDPDGKKILRGIARARHSIATDSTKQLELAMAKPTAAAAMRAGLVLPDGTLPFELWSGSDPRFGSVIADPARRARPAARPASPAHDIRPRAGTFPSHVPPEALRHVPARLTVPRSRPARYRPTLQVTGSGQPGGAESPRPRTDTSAAKGSETRFIKEIAQRGFYLGPGAKYIYYHRRDRYPKTRRVVVIGSRVRLEKQERHEWQLWRRYRLPDDLKAVLKALDRPNKGFARW
jgi:hypothetical protein